MLIIGSEVFTKESTNLNRIATLTSETFVMKTVSCHKHECSHQSPWKPWDQQPLCRRISQVSDDVRESTFLFQHLSVLIQKFNSVAGRCSVHFCPHTED